MAKKKLTPLTEEEIEATVTEAVDEAVQFTASEIVEDRVKAEKYFKGETNLDHEKGRSQVVATKCRDVVRQVKPSLMRVFLYSDKPVEYVPVNAGTVAGAEQATKFMHWKFGELGGFRILNDVMQDALVKKTGYTKTWWDEKTTISIHNFEGLDDDMTARVLDDDEVEAIEHKQYPDPDAQPQPQIDPATGQPQVGPDGQPVMGPQPMLHDLKVSRTTIHGDLMVMSMPPEELVVNKEARNVDDVYVIAHRADKRVGDLLEMGYTLEELEGLDALPEIDTGEEKEERTGFSVTPRSDENEAKDPTTKLIGVTEAYMKLDIDGTGTPALHKFLLAGGSKMKLLDYEPVEEHPFAVFEIDPEPHAFYGRSLVDIVMEDQDATTAILRGIIDNVHMVNNPRFAILNGYVNVDDMLNGEIGAIVREDQPGAIRSLDVPFVAGNTLPALMYLDQLVETKTGVTKASVGLDPDALQSTTRAAVQATIQAAAGQVEVMARNLAEGGYRRLFGQMLRLYVKNVKKTVVMQVTDGTWVPVDPRTWRATMDVRVNVGLGTGREEERAMALEATAQVQSGILQGYGLQNGLVTLTNYRNTLADALRLRGISNTDRYYQPMDQAKEGQLAAAQAQAQQGQQQPDPTQGLVQAEQIKAQVKTASDQQSAALKQQQMALDDDLKRDQMAQELGIKVAEIMAKYGMSLDTTRIKAEQAAQRPMNGPGGPVAPQAPPAPPNGAPPGMPMQ